VRARARARAALVIEHTVRMRLIVICGLWLYRIFPQLIEARFSGKKLNNKMDFLIFCTIFVKDVLYYKKNRESEV
jgi:hypothetical protein